MTAINADANKFRLAPARTGKIVLTIRPDLRIVKVSLIAAILPLMAGIATYLSSPQIDRDLKLALAVAIGSIGLAGISFLLVMYEGLAKAVYTVTDECIEEECGVVFKRVRRIPLSYIRDVTYDQNFLQAIFGVSSITVSPTNSDKIVLSNVPDGESARERIWNHVLSRSPVPKRAT